MTKHEDSAANSSQSRIYQIRIAGHLGPQWTEWFEGLTITQEAGNTTLLTGAVRDQAELHGLLRKIRDLGTPLLSIVSMPTNPTDDTD